MSTYLDPDGQPPANFCKARVRDRTIDELLGICKGLIADGVVNAKEADFLCLWLNENRAYADVWPVNVLSRRIAAMLQDRRIDAEERAELLGILRELVGGQPVHERVHSFATSLPLDDPPPDVVVRGRLFCFTGKFAYGSRLRCESAVRAKGGRAIDCVPGENHYLVIGLIGSRDWIHSTHGRKIEEAVAMREAGGGPAIIGEDHWVKFVT